MRVMRFVELFVWVTVGFSSIASAQIAPARRMDWSRAGVNGGIPVRSSICATLSPGVTAEQINAALQSCSRGQIVQLSAGTYNLSSGIDFSGKSEVTLRGAGPDRTILRFTGSTPCRGMGADICVGATSYSYYVENPTNVAQWIAGFSQSTAPAQITLSHSNGLQEGMYIVLDQLDDPADTGEVFVCQQVGVCADEGPGGGNRPLRSQQQFARVTGCSPQCPNAGTTTVTLASGLYMPNWRLSQNPQAWWGTSSGLSYGNGVEDLLVDNSANTSGNRSNIYFIWCRDCWLRNVVSLNADRNHVWLYESANCTIRDSYFDGTKNAASQSYGVESYMSSDNLVENNIFQHIVAALNANGPAAGTVYGYNFVRDNTYNASPTWMQASNYLHASGADMLLHEGNDAVGLKADVIHGTHQFTTAFRNFFTGWEPGKSSETVPVNLYAFSRYFNLVGNVLGTPGYHNNYESNTPVFAAAQTSIYRFGASGNLPPTKQDPLVAATLFRWGNFDVVSGSVRFHAAEAPSNLAKYPNPAPSTQELPPSLYLLAKPSWWPTAIPYPPIGPDVVGGDVPGYNGHVYKIPAHRCYESSAKDEKAVLTNFNADRCYPKGSSIPAAPSQLSVRP